MEFFQIVNNKFWNPKFWLPPNINWKNLKNTSKNIYYPQFEDLWISIFLAFVILIIRFIFEKLISVPIANLTSKKPYKTNLQIKSNAKFYDNIDATYMNGVNGYNKHNGYYNISQHNPLLTSYKNQESLLENLKSKNESKKIKKFSETCWRFVYYISAFIYGISILWNKPWLWDTNYCWKDYPFQHVTADIYWYYMIQMGFYWSLTISQFFDVKRKDFWQMFIHHICTILLMTFSWVTNMVRIGTLVLVIHDTVDYMLEATKIANYCKMKKLCSIIFGIFATTWFVTRLVIFPWRVLYATLFLAHKSLKTFYGAYYVYNALLLLLLLLNAFWFVIIIKMALKSIKRGEIKKDERSGSEDSDFEQKSKKE